MNGNCDTIIIRTQDIWPSATIYFPSSYCFCQMFASTFSSFEVFCNEASSSSSSFVIGLCHYLSQNAEEFPRVLYHHSPKRLHSVFYQRQTLKIGGNGFNTLFDGQALLCLSLQFIYVCVYFNETSTYMVKTA